MKRIKGSLVLLALQLLILVSGFPLDEPGVNVADLVDDQPAFIDSLNSKAQLLDDLTTTARDDDAVERGEYKSEENVGNPDVFEGDIYLDRSTRLIIPRPGRDAISNKVRHWPNARVPYTFGNVNSKVKSAFLAAVKEYNGKTCVRFVRRRSERDYIYIVAEGGCFSAIGRSGRRQKLSLGQGCERKGTAIHEMMHAIGFFHEQSREDRDRYITIKWGNIRKGMEYNFHKYKRGEADTLGAPYDYRSIMHYPKYAFTKNRGPTILTRNGASIGQRDTFSDVDLRQINKLYRCGKTKPRPTRPRPRPTPRPASCADTNRGCPRWKSYCRSSKYGRWMMTNCKKTCGGCVQCRDIKPSSSCMNWRRAGYCSSRSRYYVYMSRYCRRSCGRC